MRCIILKSCFVFFDNADVFLVEDFSGNNLFFMLRYRIFLVFHGGINFSKNRL